MLEAAQPQPASSPSVARPAVKETEEAAIETLSFRVGDAQIAVQETRECGQIKARLMAETKQPELSHSRGRPSPQVDISCKDVPAFKSSLSYLLSTVPGVCGV